jgi:hypothetical protein
MKPEEFQPPPPRLPTRLRTFKKIDRSHRVFTRRYPGLKENEDNGSELARRLGVRAIVIRKQPHDRFSRIYVAADDGTLTPLQGLPEGLLERTRWHHCAHVMVGMLHLARMLGMENGRVNAGADL